MLSRSQLPIRIGHAAATIHHLFGSVSNYFVTGVLSDWWNSTYELPAFESPRAFGDKSFVIIDGDVRCTLKVQGGSVVIVHGDVTGAIVARQSGEIVVCGDVRNGAVISEGMELFVGGDVAGIVDAHEGSYGIWIEGSFSGKMRCGRPYTGVRIQGDCTGEIEPLDRAMLGLVVGGSMPFSNIESIRDIGSTSFNGSIGSSDRPAGLYPDQESFRSLARQRQYCQWVIQR